jgi:hypothetical protein
VRPPAAFVMPYYDDGRPECRQYLRRAVASVLGQTDPDLLLFIVDDASVGPAASQHLAGVAGADPRIRVLHGDQNRGPGHCRNIGVAAGMREAAAFVCFLDADDQAHPRRVEVARALFARRPDVDVVYSSFIVVDERDVEVPRDRLINGLRIILDDLDRRPLNGRDVWIRLAAERDTLTIPSALNVRTSLAAAVPFPSDVRFHEDTHTWLRYSAAGGCVYFTPRIPSRYTVAMAVEGSRSRERAGGIEAFNRLRASTISTGLREAIGMGTARGVVGPGEGGDIIAAYLLNVAAMIAAEGSTAVAAELVAQARAEVAPERFARIAARYTVAAGAEAAPSEGRHS